MFTIHNVLRSFTVQQYKLQVHDDFNWLHLYSSLANPLMLTMRAPEQHTSPSLHADRLGTLNHSLRSHDHDLCHLHHEINRRVTLLFFQNISDLARGFATSTCLNSSCRANTSNHLTDTKALMLLVVRNITIS